MRYYPDPESLEEEIKNSAAELWMVEQLRRNYSYVSWGPHEDYQGVADLSDPNSPRKFPNWASFRKGFTPNKHPVTHQDRSGGEVVGWYFNIARETTKCVRCDGGGLNPESKKISDDWYDFARTGRRWDKKLTQDEVDALLENGRLSSFVNVSTRGELDALVENGRITAERAEELWDSRDKKFDREFDADDGITKHYRVHIKWRDAVPVDEVNGRESHDGINKWICVETRCKRLGVWGYCEACGGRGYMPVDLKGRLQLVLWIVNPATGQNYGLEVDNIEEDEIEDVHDFLGWVQKRLVYRLDMPSTIECPSGQDPAQAFGKTLKHLGRGESMMWTQDGSVLSGGGGWGQAHYWNSWEEFCWPTHYTYGNRDNQQRVPKNHPKFNELNVGKPAYGLDDLNEMIGVRFEYGPHNKKIERVHFWIAHPRKGCSCRLTINNITPQDYASIQKYVAEGRARTEVRLDPAVTPEE